MLKKTITLNIPAEIYELLEKAREWRGRTIYILDAIKAQAIADLTAKAADQLQAAPLAPLPPSRLSDALAHLTPPPGQQMTDAQMEEAGRILMERTLKERAAQEAAESKGEAPSKDAPAELPQAGDWL